MELFEALRTVAIIGLYAEIEIASGGGPKSSQLVLQLGIGLFSLNMTLFIKTWLFLQIRRVLSDFEGAREDLDH